MNHRPQSPDEEAPDDSETNSVDWNADSSASGGRCAACLTTWETLRRDGRAGCPACYVAFRGLLEEVMARVQRGPTHTGKLPRAAQKRGRHLENIDKRRHNQLELLQNRLREAIEGQRFEEAAALRDKIQGLN